MRSAVLSLRQLIARQAAMINDHGANRADQKSQWGGDARFGALLIYASGTRTRRGG